MGGTPRADLDWVWNGDPSATYQYTLVTMTTPPVKTRFPTRTTMKNRAIVSDLLNCAATVLKTGHRTGLNVLYNDGSVRWHNVSKTPRSSSPGKLDQALAILKGFDPVNGGGLVIDSAAHAPLAQAWEYFDRN